MPSPACSTFVADGDVAAFGILMQDDDDDDRLQTDYRQITDRI